MREVSQTVINALRLIECFQEKEELGITELAGEIGIGKTAVARLVSSLESFGYLRQNPATKRYRLGLKFVYLSSLVQDRKELVNLVGPYLRALSQEFQVTAHLAVYDKRGSLIADKVTAGPMVYMDSKVGTVLPIHACATGKCLLAFGEERIWRSLLTKPLEKITDRTVTDPKLFEAALMEIRKQGYSLDDGESTVGLFCISVPLLDHGGSVVAAISLSGQEWFMTENKEKVLKRLFNVQKELEMYL